MNSEEGEFPLARDEAHVEVDRPAATCAALLIGYGNTMRRDDGVGPAVVSRLASALRDRPSCQFSVVRQLAPELAEELAGAQRVIFVDASVELPPGKVSVRPIHPCAGGSVTCALAHYEAPEFLLALAQTLYGAAPQTWLIAVGVEDLSVGDRLSPALSEASARLCRHLAYRLERWSYPFEHQSD